MVTSSDLPVTLEHRQHPVRTVGEVTEREPDDPEPPQQVLAPLRAQGRDVVED